MAATTKRTAPAPRARASGAGGKQVPPQQGANDERAVRRAFRAAVNMTGSAAIVPVLGWVWSAGQAEQHLGRVPQQIVHLFLSISVVGRSG